MGSAQGCKYFDNKALTTRHKMLFAIIILGTFFDQMDNYNFSFIAPAIMKQWGVSLEQIANINFMYFLSMLVGGIFAGFLVDKWGRKKTLLTGILLFSVGSILNGLATDINMFLLTRCFTGFGVAGLIVTEPVYLSEMTPTTTRGKWGSLALGLALISAPIIGSIAKIIIPASAYGWRVIFFISGLGIFLFFLGVKYLVESPRWLMSKGRFEEANKAFKYLTGDDLTIDPTAVVTDKKTNVIEYLKVMFSKEYLRMTILLVTLSFAGVGASFMFMSYSPTLLTKEGFSLADSLRMSSLFSFGLPIGAIIASYFTDKGGRKIPLSVTLFVYGVFAIIFGRVTHMDTNVIIAVGFIMAMCHIAWFSMSTTYIVENYPTYLRGFAYGSVTYLASRLGTTLAQKLVPVLYKEVGYASYYLFIGIVLITFAVLVLIFGRKTAGIDLEELHGENTRCIKTEGVNV